MTPSGAAIGRVLGEYLPATSSPGVDPGTGVGITDRDVPAERKADASCAMACD